MNDVETKILNDLKIDAVLNSLIEETSKLNLKQSDYLKLMNALMDVSLMKKEDNNSGNRVEDYTKIKKVNLPLVGDRVKIRLFKNDFELVKKWLKDDIGKWFLLSSSHSSDKTIDQLVNNDKNILGIITLLDNTPIGMMGFLDCDEVSHKAEMRKLIGETEHRGKGYAKEATSLWIKYGFGNLGLKKVYIHTIENSIRNITINRELGFEIEGVLRKECFVEGNYYDILRMSLIIE